MTGKKIVEAWEQGGWANERRAHAELICAIDAAIAAEREKHLPFLLLAYDSLGRTGWEDGLNDTEAKERIFHHLCRCDCDPNLSQKAKAIRARGTR